MAGQTNVSVIIPSYNSIKTIGKTIKGLENQTSIKNLIEILIVDSSDDDATHTFLVNHPNPIIKVIRSGYKVIPSIQRNIGAKQAKAELLCFIDSDAIPADNWIEKIIEVFNKGYKVGGGSYLIPEFQINKSIAWAEYFLEFSQFIYKKQPLQYTNMVPSCNLFCEKSVFDAVEGFPEIRAAEDSHFGLKINQLNYKMVFDPEIIVYHIFRENRQHFLRNERMIGKFNLVYRKNSSDSFVFRGYVPVIILPVFIITKFTRIFNRVRKTNAMNLKKFIRALPLIFSGIFAWSKGVVDGVRDYNEIGVNN